MMFGKISSDIDPVFMNNDRIKQEIADLEVHIRRIRFQKRKKYKKLMRMRTYDKQCQPDMTQSLRSLVKYLREEIYINMKRTTLLKKQLCKIKQ